MPESGVVDMGRPKGKRIPPPPEERKARETVIHMKGSPEYVDYIDDFHQSTRISKVELFRMGIELLAEKNKFRKPPKI
jgi:hypothetical protein